MNIQVTSTVFRYDDEYNVTEVTAHYSIAYNADGLSERGSGNLRISQEEYEGNESPAALAELIKSKRGSAVSE